MGARLRDGLIYNNFLINSRVGVVEKNLLVGLHLFIIIYIILNKLLMSIHINNNRVNMQKFIIKC